MNNSYVNVVADNATCTRVCDLPTEERVLAVKAKNAKINFNEEQESYMMEKISMGKITVKRDPAKVASDVPYVVKGRIPCCCACCSLFSRITHKYRKANNQDEGVLLQCLLTENCIISNI